MNEARAKTTITHLGPYNVSGVTDDILGDVVYNKGIPIIIKQGVNNETVYAVLAKNKDVRIACAGCFKRDMRITDSTRCKKCASHVKHCWDTRAGQRKDEYKDTGSDIKDIAANCRQVDFIPSSLKTIDTTDLIAELKR